MSKQVLFSFFIASISFIVVEPLAYFAGQYLQEKGVFYRPTVGSSYSSYLVYRDPVVGWPAPSSYGAGDRDRTGSRIVPAFPDPDEHEACISIYGNSFTWSSDVASEHAWGNVLAQWANCRVANYGVGGYGTDQAYLRFKNNEMDSAPIVILGYLSENIMRNITQYRDLVYAHGGLGFKPRFIFDENGRFTLIRLPTIAASEYIQFVHHPERYLEHDYFAPGGPAGIRRLDFPYVWSVAMAFRHFIIQTKIKGVPWYADFYQSDHPSQALPIATRILGMFEQEARSRGKQPLIVIYPTVLDLLYYQKEKVWIYQNLIDDLHSHAIEPLNIGIGMIDYIGDRDPWQLYTDHSALGFNSQVQFLV